jgi:hypothetical protein
MGDEGNGDGSDGDGGPTHASLHESGGCRWRQGRGERGGIHKGARLQERRKVRDALGKSGANGGTRAKQRGGNMELKTNKRIRESSPGWTGK